MSGADSSSNTIPSQDQLYGGKALDAALEAAIDQWMGWTIGRQTSRETGIPRGLPYLTGFVINEGLMAEGEVVWAFRRFGDCCPLCRLSSRTAAQFDRW